MPTSTAALKELLGFVEEPNSGVCYIECENLATFKSFFTQIRNVGSAPPPRQGGMVNEEIAVRIPSGKAFFAISYRGEGMLHLITEYASHCGVRSARIEGEDMIISDGQRESLLNCDLVKG